MRKETVKWTTREGKKIRLCDMTTAHIKNCMALIKEKTLQALSAAETLFDGEIASDNIADEIDNLVEDEFETAYPEIYYKMEAELMRREE